MIDVFLLMLSMAVHGAGQAASGGDSIGGVSTGSRIVGSEATTAEIPKTETATTALAPAGQSAAAAPSFLAPETDSQTAAAPAFLAPADSGGGTGGQTSASAPLFLSPSDAPKPALVAEPQVPTGKFTIATEVKPILGMTKGNWISVREFNGQDLLYVTHIWSWRCGLLEMKVGLNGAPPEVWPLPECHLDAGTPNAILDGDGNPYREFPLGSIQQIEVHLIFDDLSTDSAKLNRQGVEMQ